MIQFVKNSYKEIFLFLKNPVDIPYTNNTLKEKAIKFFLLMVLNLVLAGTILILLMYLSKIGLISMDSSIEDFIRTLSKGEIIFLMVILVPLVEEVIFRLYLRYRRNYLLRGLISIFYLAGKSHKERIEERVKRIWYKRYGYIFYMSALIFGLVHIVNYDTDKNLLLLFPLITAPQIIAGVFTGYLRVRFSFFWGYYFHAAHNLIVLLPFLLLVPALEPYDLNNYSITIEEVCPNDEPGEAKFSPDSVWIRNFSLKDHISFASGKGEFLITSNNEEKMNVKFNFSLKKKSACNADYKQIIGDYLARHFNYERHTHLKLAEVWHLTVTDSLKLIQHRTDSLANYISLMNDSIIVWGTPFTSIAYAIQKSKMKLVLIKDNMEGNFNVKLGSADIEDLRLQLENLYGLSLIDTMAIEEFLKIEFIDQPHSQEETSIHSSIF